MVRRILLFILCALCLCGIYPTAAQQCLPTKPDGSPCISAAGQVADPDGFAIHFKFSNGCRSVIEVIAESEQNDGKVRKRSEFIKGGATGEVVCTKGGPGGCTKFLSWSAKCTFDSEESTPRAATPATAPSAIAPRETTCKADAKRYDELCNDKLKGDELKTCIRQLDNSVATCEIVGGVFQTPPVLETLLLSEKLQREKKEWEGSRTGACYNAGNQCSQTCGKSVGTSGTTAERALKRLDCVEKSCINAIKECEAGTRTPESTAAASANYRPPRSIEPATPTVLPKASVAPSPGRSASGRQPIYCPGSTGPTSGPPGCICRPYLVASPGGSTCFRM